MTESRFICTVKVPPRRRDWEGKFDNRAGAVAEALARPGNWNEEVTVTSPRTVTFVHTNHASDLPDIVALDELARQIGYHASDTLGPRTRKALLTYDGPISGSRICPGSW